ncbi:DUF2207 domain-containing protein [Nonomuraea sp. LPB2021202275-12-8]|uniref:DUF2207 domain-containing protein n=1 Tax=Nonomuraea sp. LPB2021202275-12-8 TaxID=3120159 RepID=UPI00300C51F0
MLICALCTLPLACGAPAQAATADDAIYTLPGTAVLAEVGADGRVKVTEKHTFTWRQPGHRAYLDIPLSSGMRAEDISVSEGDTAYRRGPDVAVDGDRPAGTYGTRCCDAEQQRVTWYFSAGPGSTRTFTVRYTLRGAVTAYRDQAFLSLPVWGEDWPQTLDLLQVEVRLPLGRGPGAGVLESAKEPALTVDATTRTATMTERRIAPGQARTVELAFPRGLLDKNPAGAHVESGSGGSRLAGLRTAQSDTLAWVLIIIMMVGVLGLMLWGLVDHLMKRRRPSRSSGAGSRSSGSSYGGYSGSGYSSGYYGGSGGSSSGGGGGGAC